MTRYKFGYLLSTILTLLFSIAFGLLMIVITNQHKDAGKGYDFYSIRTYTYVSSKKVKRYKSGSIYEINVINFLQACEATGVTVHIKTNAKISKYTTENARAHNSNEPNSFLFKLRCKLGLAFSR